ncbi:ABC transporter permease [Kitasatospora viridis]|uniref:Putative ABC transport system permease protein n=1 Tax=Kitasatospora viridis TaxID=281105 RepID=A0A561ULB6_9ACTN|nr:FtsX-like permease family protein [Kitasatospora viridis]TWG00154.1 putative ABC transport system permease protein [Kitasatospora viridis]
MLYRTALRNVLAHKGRLLMTVLAVLLGTAFVAGTLVFADSVDASFRNSISSSYRGISVQVTDTATGPDAGPMDRTGGAQPLTDATLRALAALPGTAAARGTVTGFAGIADAQGKLIGRRGDTHGTNWSPGPDGSDPRYPMLQGAGPSDEHGIAVDSGTAAARHFKVGDTVRLAVTGPVAQVTVTGIFRTDDPQVRAGGSLVLLDTATAQRYYGKPGEYGAVALTAKPGVGADELAAQAARVVPGSSNIEIQTVDQLRSAQLKLVELASRTLEFVLLCFAAIALFVGIFVISNTFSMLIAQRTRELALLRAVGASRRQVRRSVLAEASVVGAVASVLGLLVGIGIGSGMQALMSSWGSQAMAGTLVIAPTTVLVTLLAGVLVTIVSALLPAVRASRVPPMAALNSVEAPIRRRGLVLRNSVGLALAVLGLAVVLFESGRHGEGAMRLVALGALLLVLGVLVLTPLLSRPAIALVGPVYGRLFGVSGRLARRNAVRNPRRTAATASALTIGIGLISALTVLGSSMTSAVDQQVTEGMRADYQVSALFGQPLSPAAIAAIAAAPGVAATEPLDQEALQLPDQPAPMGVAGVDPAGLDRQMVPTMVSGSTAALAQGQLLVEQASASRSGWTVGTSLNVTYPDGSAGTLTIGGIFQSSDLEGPSLLSEAVLRRHVTRPFYGSVLVRGTDGATAALQQALRDATGDNPLIQVQSHHDLQVAFAARTVLLLEVMYGLLTMAVVIAVLGVVNTLAMSVFERRCEIGLLRAIGLDRSGVRRMLRLEAVVIAVFGAVLGVATGVLLAWSVVRMTKDAVADLSLVLPYGQLTLYVLGAGAVGLLAALWPARLATRAGVLAGIAAE